MSKEEKTLSEKPLIGYVSIESESRDAKTNEILDWTGYITGPENPKGANLAWLDPIEMIETKALKQLEAKYERLVEAAKKHVKDSSNDTMYCEPDSLEDMEIILTDLERNT